jgi:hypothetical protein
MAEQTVPEQTVSEEVEHEDEITPQAGGAADVGTHRHVYVVLPYRDWAALKQSPPRGPPPRLAQLPTFDVRPPPASVAASATTAKRAVLKVRLPDGGAVGTERDGELALTRLMVRKAWIYRCGRRLRQQQQRRRRGGA